MSEDIRKLLDVKIKEKDAILDKTGPLRAEREGLYEKIIPLEVRAKTLADEIKAIEQPRLSELEREISGLAKALGGKSLSGK